MVQYASFVSIILAGGQSRRMGRSKAKLQIEDQTLVERQVELVRPFSTSTLVICTTEDDTYFSAVYESDPSVVVLTDLLEVKGQGPLAGIYSGMMSIDADWYFVLACDMIYYPEELLKKCKEYCYQQDHSVYDAYIPMQDARIQPLAAIYRGLPSLIHRLIQQDMKRMTDLLEHIKVCYIVDELWNQWTLHQDPFYNLNYTEEYHRLMRLMHEDDIGK